MNLPRVAHLDENQRIYIMKQYIKLKFGIEVSDETIKDLFYFVERNGVDVFEVAYEVGVSAYTSMEWVDRMFKKAK